MWTNALGHLIAGSTILDGTLIRHGDPGDPDRSSPEPGPAHGSYPPAFPIPPVDSSIDANIQARVGFIGPAPNPANNRYLALNRYKYLVPNSDATLPGSVCPTCTPTVVTPALSPGRHATWRSWSNASGGAIVLGHSQGATEVLYMVRILKEHGKPNLLKGVFFPEGPTVLGSAGLTGADFDHVPFLVVNGDYGASAPGLTPAAVRATNYAARDAINASPTHAVAPATVIDLDDPSFKGQFNQITAAGGDIKLAWLPQLTPGSLYPGSPSPIFGNDHIMMLDKNNLQVADVLIGWATSRGL
jgi:hypothetical protein